MVNFLDLRGVLETQEDAERGPLVRFQVEQVPLAHVLGDVLVEVVELVGLDVKHDLPVGHLVGRVAGDDLRQRRLPAAVGTHQRVDLVRVHRQIHALQDLLTAVLRYRSVQIRYFESCHILGSPKSSEDGIVLPIILSHSPMLSF
jgi:hypothetical protein